MDGKVDDGQTKEVVGRRWEISGYLEADISGGLAILIEQPERHALKRERWIQPQLFDCGSCWERVEKGRTYLTCLFKGSGTSKKHGATSNTPPFGDVGLADPYVMLRAHPIGFVG